MQQLLHHIVLKLTQKEKVKNITLVNHNSVTQELMVLCFRTQNPHTTPKINTNFTNVHKCQKLQLILLFYK